MFFFGNSCNTKIVLLNLFDDVAVAVDDDDDDDGDINDDDSIEEEDCDALCGES